MDWQQLWEITVAPDNVPIVILGFLTPLYLWMAFKEARSHDRLILQLEAEFIQVQRVPHGGNHFRVAVDFKHQ